MSEETVDVQLARIDERTCAIQSDLHALQESIGSTYVTREEFKPVKGVVYGLIAIMGTSLVGALIALVLRR